MPDEHKDLDKNITAYPSSAAAWTTVLVLSLTYMFSMMDRQILVLLIEPIKTDLNITDTQVSLLAGIAFAIVYTFMGVPMGRVADLWVRKYVIIFGVTIWSLLTMVSGFARNFWQLFVARMGVGFGEAALTPTAYALIPDLFPPQKLARAMSVFVLGGIAIGSGMSLLVGGVVIGLAEDMGTLSLPLIGELRPWRLVLLVVGFLSLLMVIPLSMIKEPIRRGVDDRLQSTRDEGGTSLPFKSVLAYLWDHKAFYGPYMIGVSVANLFAYGSAAWIPSYFIRLHQWDAATTGMTLGLLFLVPAVVGCLAGGWLADHFYDKGYRGAALYIMTTVLALAVPCVLLFIYLPWLELNLIFLVLMWLFANLYFVLFPTVLQMATPNKMRGQVSAIHLLAANLVGIGFGPTAIALITDYGLEPTLPYRPWGVA